MPTYKTPGVHVEEIRRFPPSVVPVETAIPAFIGYTEKATDKDGSDLKGVPKRITSVFEYERFFGNPMASTVEVSVTDRKGDLSVTFHANKPPEVAGALLPYAIRHFYSNGGGPCYVISQGLFDDADAKSPKKANFTDAFTTLESRDEVTLLVFPDATRADVNIYGSIVTAALQHCAKMQDRFAICDVKDALPGKNEDNDKVKTEFRGRIASDLGDVKYGAAYFPYLRTSLELITADGSTTIKEHKVEQADGSLADGGLKDKNLTQVLETEKKTAVYNAVKVHLAGAAVATLPPSGAVAGIYARTDSRRGVWKAPANVSVNNVIEPAIAVTDDLNSSLNVDPDSGKSVNVIRSFAGKGALVWGARTLAGNDNENRYVPVRRFLNFAEESIKKATAFFVFEPNDANTWTKVRTMVENFLTVQWRDGALVGQKPEHAYYVKVGLNETMSAEDVLNGYMILEIGLAIVRPAEFIVLRFAHKMQES